MWGDKGRNVSIRYGSAGDVCVRVCWMGGGGVMVQIVRWRPGSPWTSVSPVARVFRFTPRPTDGSADHSAIICPVHCTETQRVVVSAPAGSAIAQQPRPRLEHKTLEIVVPSCGRAQQGSG